MTQDRKTLMFTFYRHMNTLYGIMTEERVICEIRIDEAASRGDSDSRMTCFEVIMPLKLQSTNIYIYIYISDLGSNTS